MAVITISGEYGSEASEIARRVAAALNYHYVDTLSIEKILDEYGLVEFKEMYESMPNLLSRFDEVNNRMKDMLDRVLRALAKHGNVVIRGRGGFAVLGGLADVLTVRTQAPLAVRAQRVMVREQIDELAHATEMVQHYDRVRSTFVESSYNDVVWNSADAFNLVIDTGKIPLALAVDWIIEAHQAVALRETGAEPTARDLVVDDILAQVIAEKLKCAIAH
ncbi:MAG: cytidylate kinase-like family protein [Thermoflexales bacterium]|nr:cytidylate kinase-like family protein [Thermoflexales bacterium]